MAWQLIYTSAPRSLEAGRSGFGTVARHRTISPLLVSAIERTSQFSRLPGVDTGRVIFCYRIVAVAGGRFHVLSSIRDAGADYTGRTNHIAHHLIADPREVAQLGANGPSPADVLLAMQWATSWTEQPRFLEATEEIALATIRPTNSSAWQGITGSPEQAWLLASRDASRGAYVIQPAGTDLRVVFAESLRLIPERLWQISFTTSLQPSDEPADFRWIGIEERSPLRAQTESSGRTILNLAVPSTLPLVEVAQPTAASPIRQSLAQTSAPLSGQGRTVSPTATSMTTPQKPSRTQNGHSAETQPISATAATRSHRNWWLPASAMTVLVAALIAFFVGRPIYAKYEHRMAVCAEMAAMLKKAGFFSENVSEELKKADAIDLAKEIAVAGSELVEVANNAAFGAMKIRRPNDELRKRARDAHLFLPAEIADLDERLSKIEILHQHLTDFVSQSDGYEAFAELQKWREEVDQLTSLPAKSEIFAKIKSEITPLADQRQAKALFVLVTGPSEGRLPPKESYNWFNGALNRTNLVSGDKDAKMTLNATRDLVTAWTDFEKPRSALDWNIDLAGLEKRLADGSRWPIWLQKKAQGKIAAALPKSSTVANESVPVGPLAPKPVMPVSSRLTFYFFADNKDLSFPLPAGDVPLKFFLRVPGKGDKEVSPYGPALESIPDERSLGPDGDYFRRRGGNLEAANKPPKPPYRLILKRGANEVIRIFVGQPPSDEVMLHNDSIELKPDGQILGMLPKLASTDDARFVLVNTGSIDGTSKTYRLSVNAAGQCDLKPAADAIRRRIAEKTAQAELYLKQAKEYDATAKSPGNVRAKAKQYAAKILNSEGMKTFSGEKSDAEAVGTFAVALADQWTPKKGENPFAALRDAGKTLADAQQNKDAALTSNKVLEDLTSKLASKHTDGNKGEGLGQLRSLCQNLKTALGDSKSTEAEVKKLDALGKDAARDASVLQNQPLLRDRLPGGNYTLFAQPKDGEDIKLRTFNLPQP